MLIKWSESVKEGVEASKQVFELARVLKENKDHETFKALIEKARKSQEKPPLKNALAAFHFQKSNHAHNSVEFFHKSFGEFFGAECLAESMEEWTQKARQLQKYHLKRGQRQVDIYTGLNVLILLLEINRYAQSNEILKDKISFYPCGNPDIKMEFDGNRLLRIMGYSECLEHDKFRLIVGKFLENANLQKA